MLRRMQHISKQTTSGLVGPLRGIDGLTEIKKAFIIFVLFVRRVNPMFAKLGIFLISSYIRSAPQLLSTTVNFQQILTIIE